MQITLLALGSRGDVQPFVALGRVLRERGHSVRLAAVADYAPLAAAEALPFAPLVGEVGAYIDADAMGAMHRAGRAALVRRFFRDVPPLLTKLCADVQRASAGSDLLVASSLAQWAVGHLDAQARLPLAIAHFHPVYPTASTPQPFFPAAPRWLPLAGRYHRLTYRLFDLAHWLGFGAGFNRARRELLGLPALGPLSLVRRFRAWHPPTLYGYSRVLAPPPFDAPADLPITGPWVLPAPTMWHPSAALAAFLEAGPPPIAISFGSVMFGQQEGERLTAMLLAAAERADMRLIIGRGWGDLGNLPATRRVLVVDSLPHEWLFARVRGVVHHGGAGVTVAALRANSPALVVPVLGDQSFWGEQVAAHGAGPAPVPFRQLTVETLVQSFGQLRDDDGLHRRAAALGAVIRAERGAETAADYLGRLA